MYLEVNSTPGYELSTNNTNTNLIPYDQDNSNPLDFATPDNLYLQSQEYLFNFLIQLVSKLLNALGAPKAGFSYSQDLVLLLEVVSAILEVSDASKILDCLPTIIQRKQMVTYLTTQSVYLHEKTLISHVKSLEKMLKSTSSAPLLMDSTEVPSILPTNSNSLTSNSPRGRRIQGMKKQDYVDRTLF